MIAKLTSSERQNALILAAIVALAGMAMAALGRSDVLGVHGLIVMLFAGIETGTEEILITSGSQMGLELIATLLCDPGDVVLAEGPTYVGAIGTFAGLEAEVVHVASDDDGLVPERLEEAIARLR